MRLLRFIGALAVVIVLQVIAVSWWPGAARFLDLFSLVAVFYALSGELLPAILVGAAFGLAHDAFSGGPFGLHGFADTLMAYMVALAAQRLVLGRALSVFLLFAVATLFERLVLVGLLALLLPRLTSLQLPWLALAILINGLLGVLLFEARKRLRARRSLRGLARASKIRLGP